MLASLMFVVFVLHPATFLMTVRVCSSSPKVNTKGQEFMELFMDQSEKSEDAALQDYVHADENRQKCRSIEAFGTEVPETSGCQATNDKAMSK